MPNFLQSKKKNAGCAILSHLDRYHSLGKQKNSGQIPTQLNVCHIHRQLVCCLSTLTEEAFLKNNRRIPSVGWCINTQIHNDMCYCIRVIIFRVHATLSYTICYVGLYFEIGLHTYHLQRKGSLDITLLTSRLMQHELHWCVDKVYKQSQAISLSKIL